MKANNNLMIQGTMSGAGKSLLTAGILRVLARKGYKVAPFKSQNMALNSYITEEGLEMGRAQVMQAEAAKVKPSVHMNPVLLKPDSDMGSQVIVQGKVIGNMSAKEYFQYKTNLIPRIMDSYQKLQKEYDAIVIEGAGSPAEINLKAQDIVNMGLAQMVDAPVLLVGDIDRGGVFAQLYGTYALLEKEEQERVKGFVINKFRGDKKILEPGLSMFAPKCPIPFEGVIPYVHLDIEDEDSLTGRFQRKGKEAVDVLKIGVVLFPHISNFTDFAPLEAIDGVSVEYVKNTMQWDAFHAVILPGSKNTIGDLRWMRRKGLESLVLKYANKGGTVLGICGGFQMLGKKLTDPNPNGILDETAPDGRKKLYTEHEQEQGVLTEHGLDLLPIETVFDNRKVTTRVRGVTEFIGKGRCEFSGYEIHMGETTYLKEGAEFSSIETEYGENGSKEHNLQKDLLHNASSQKMVRRDGAVNGNVAGTYVHGIFEDKSFTDAFIEMVCRRNHLDYANLSAVDFAKYKDTQYELLADTIEENLNMDTVYRLLGL